MAICYVFSSQLKLDQLFKVVKFLIILTCATLCIYQVCQLLNQYFAYDVEVQTTVGNIQDKTLPTISICVYYKIYGNGGVPREIRNLFTQAAYDFNHRILRCSLVLKNGDQVECESVTKSEKFLNLDYVCHSLFTENTEYLTDFHSNIFLAIDVNMTDTGDELSLALYHQNQVDINCDSIGVDYLYRSKHDVTSYSYIENSFHLLPSPFNSMCVHYNSRFNNSRRNLIERCAQRRSYYNSTSKYCRYHDRKCVTGGAFISEKDVKYHLNYTIPDVHFGYNFEAPAPERRFCYNQLRARECQTREFAIRRTGTAKSYEIRKQKKHRILFFKPKIAGLDVQEVQLLSFGMALSAIAGILNLWSNMAFIDITNLVLPIVWEFVKRGFTKNGSGTNGVWVEVKPIVRQLEPRYTKGGLISLRRESSPIKREPASNAAKLRFLNTIIYCIGLLFCCGHIYRICNLYIEHPFQTEVSLLKKPTFKLQPLSICTALDMQPNSSFNQTFDHYLKQTKFVEMFQGILRTVSTRRYQIVGNSSVVTSLRRARVCFTLFLGLPKNTTNIDPKIIDSFNETFTGHLNKATFQDTWFIHFRVNIKYCPTGLDIVLHNHDTDLDSSFANGNQLTYRRPLNRTIQYFLTYLIYEKSLISDHYKSNCSYYKRLGFNDRDDAIRQCTLNSFIERHHQIPNNYFVSDSQTTLINMTFSHLKAFNERMKCKIKYPKSDCFSSELKLLQRYYYFTNEFGQIKFVLMAPQAYNYYTSQTLRNSLLEFVGNIGGTVALWIGWSFYDLHKIAKILIDKFK